MSETVRVRKAQGRDQAHFASQAMELAILQKALESHHGLQERSGKIDPSKSIPDPWMDLPGPEDMLQPPLDPIKLALFLEDNSELRQCIEAMAINIGGFGYRIRLHDKCSEIPALLETIDKVEDPQEKADLLALAAKIEDEEARVEEFFEYCDYDDNSFTHLRRRTRMDWENQGNAYWQVIRNAKGIPDAFELIPPQTVRLTLKHPDVVEVVQLRPVGKGKNRKFRKVKQYRRFRRYVQAMLFSGGLGYQQIFFKEYGDPRVMDNRTGLFLDEEAAKELPEEYRATEILHWKHHTALSPYGIPRYAGVIITMLGIQEAEEINYNTFRNNMIPALALLCAGGMVTEDSVTRLEEFFKSQVTKAKSMSTVVIIEAEPFEDEETGAIKLEMRPLKEEQHTDALFQNYDKRGKEKIRESFRLPPILVGRSDDYTRSTAETSRKLADEQVFDPERRDEDFRLNRILASMGVMYHVIRTNTPNVTNDTDLVMLMNGAERIGAMTPRIGKMVMEDVMNRELPSPRGIPLDEPFSLTMADRVKNNAKPNEVGQQVTALKVARALETGDLTTLDQSDVGQVVRILYHVTGLIPGEAP